MPRRTVASRSGTCGDRRVVACLTWAFATLELLSSGARLRAQDFHLACSPNATSIQQGASVRFSCSVNSVAGFSGPTGLDCVNPAGVSCSFDFNPVTPPANGGVSTPGTIAVDASVPVGPITVRARATGPGGVLVHTSDMALDVTPGPDFSHGCAVSDADVEPGGSVNVFCTTASQFGFAGAVTLDCTGLPAGVTCAYSQTPVNLSPALGVGNTLTVSVAGNVPLGPIDFTSRATSGAVVHDSPVHLTVATAPSQDFRVTCAQSSLTAQLGTTVNANCGVESVNGFNAPVTMSCSGSPPGTSCSFSVQPVTPPVGGTRLFLARVTAGSTSIPGTAAFQIIGTDGGVPPLSHSWPVAAFTVTGATLTAVNTALAQNFDSLAASGTSALAAPGWSFAEAGAGADGTYLADDGAATVGDTRSLGTTGSSDRAFGGLRDGSTAPVFGISLTNATGQALGAFDLSYVGEQWRLGQAGRPDRLDFQYSLDATSLDDGTWTDVDALAFASPDTTGTVGPTDGNSAGHRTAVSGTLDLALAAVPTALPPGARLWLRWLDPDAPGPDDALAIDDFSITPRAVTPVALLEVTVE
jgi:hypothetical protein